MLINICIWVSLAIATLLVIKMFLPTNRRRKKRRSTMDMQTTKPTVSASDQPPSSSVATGTSIHPHHAVAVVMADDACKAVQQIQGTRYLSADAPTIPLPNCDSSNCQCHYQHYEDRRQPDSERRIDFGITHDLYGAFGEQNRRGNSRGRRKTD
ncbi:hypothetical protein [Shewanella waksmanii]|uniref:hypothetical protein n=1 Tax=Shewanella waksmanii TaxID=213783 RepID=UPI003736FBCE